MEIGDDKELVLSNEDISLSSNIIKDMSVCDKYDHEEADSRVFSYIAEAVKSAYDNFAILTGDKML